MDKTTVLDLLTRRFSPEEALIVASALGLNPSIPLTDESKRIALTALNALGPEFKSLADRIQEALGIDIASQLAGSGGAPESRLAEKVVPIEKGKFMELLALLIQTSLTRLAIDPSAFTLSISGVTSSPAVQNGIRGLVVSLQRYLECINLIGEDGQLNQEELRRLQGEYFSMQERGQDVSRHPFDTVVSIVRIIIGLSAVGEEVQRGVKSGLDETALKFADMDPFAGDIASSVVCGAVGELPIQLIKGGEDKLLLGEVVENAVDGAILQAYGADLEGYAPGAFYKGILESKIAAISKKHTEVADEGFGRDWLDSQLAKGALADYGYVSPEVTYQPKKPIDEAKGVGSEKDLTSVYKRSIPEIISDYSSGRELLSVGNFIRGDLPKFLGKSLLGAVAGSLTGSPFTGREIEKIQKTNAILPSFDPGAILSVGLPVGPDARPSNLIYPISIGETGYGRLARGLQGISPRTAHKLLHSVGAEGMRLLPLLGGDLSRLREITKIPKPEVPDYHLLKAFAPFRESKSIADLASYAKSMVVPAKPRPILGANFFKHVGNAYGPKWQNALSNYRKEGKISPALLAPFAGMTSAMRESPGGFTRIMALRKPSGRAIAEERLEMYRRLARAGRLPPTGKQAVATQSPDYTKALAQYKRAQLQQQIQFEKARRKTYFPDATGELGQRVSGFVQRQVDNVLAIPGKIGAGMIATARDRIIVPLLPIRRRETFRGLGIGNKATRAVEGGLASSVALERSRLTRVAALETQLLAASGGNLGDYAARLRSNFVFERQIGPGGSAVEVRVPVLAEDVYEFTNSLQFYRNAMLARQVQSVSLLDVFKDVDVYHSNAGSIQQGATTIDQLPFGQAVKLIAQAEGFDTSRPLLPNEVARLLRGVNDLGYALAQEVVDQKIVVSPSIFSPRIQTAIQQATQDRLISPGSDSDSVVGYYRLLALLEDPSEQARYGLTPQDVSLAQSQLLARAGGVDTLTYAEMSNASEIMSVVTGAARDRARAGERLINLSSRLQFLWWSILGIKNAAVSFVNGKPIKTVVGLAGGLSAMSSLMRIKTGQKVFGGMYKVFGHLETVRSFLEEPGETARAVVEDTLKTQGGKLLKRGLSAIWDNLKRLFGKLQLSRRIGFWLFSKGLIGMRTAAGVFGLTSAQIAAATGVTGATIAGGTAAGVGSAAGASALVSAAGALTPVGWIVAIIAVVVICLCCLVVCLEGGLISNIGITVKEATGGPWGESLYGPQVFSVRVTTEDSFVKEPAGDGGYVKELTYIISAKYIGQSGTYRVNSLSGEMGQFDTSINPSASIVLNTGAEGYTLSSPALSESEISYAFLNDNFYGMEFEYTEPFDVEFRLRVSFDNTIDKILSGAEGKKKLCNIVTLSGMVDGQVVTASDFVCISPLGEVVDEVVCPFRNPNGAITCTQGPYSSPGWSHYKKDAIDVTSPVVVSPVRGKIVDVSSRNYCNEAVHGKKYDYGGKVVVLGHDDGRRYDFVHIKPSVSLNDEVLPGDSLGVWSTGLISEGNACWSAPHIHATIIPNPANNVDCEYRNRFKCDYSVCKCSSGVDCKYSCF